MMPSSHLRRKCSREIVTTTCESMRRKQNASLPSGCTEIFKIARAGHQSHVLVLLPLILV